MESVRSFPTPEPTPVISIDFAPHKGSYTFTVGETVFSPTGVYYAYNQEVITLTATTTFSGQGQSPVSYEWVFGDGTRGSGSTATHTYLSPGEFTVTVIVTDNRGVRWKAHKALFLKPHP